LGRWRIVVEGRIRSEDRDFKSRIKIIKSIAGAI
jgi:hypothetical protein